jgi:hypothetical protein
VNGFETKEDVEKCKEYLLEHYPSDLKRICKEKYGLKISKESIKLSRGLLISPQEKQKEILANIYDCSLKDMMHHGIYTFSSSIPSCFYSFRLGVVKYSRKGSKRKYTFGYIIFPFLEKMLWVWPKVKEWYEELQVEDSLAIRE